MPCGVREHGVTSLADLGLPVTMADVDVAMKRAFEDVFGPVEASTAHFFIGRNLANAGRYDLPKHKLLHVALYATRQ